MTLNALDGIVVGSVNIVCRCVRYLHQSNRKPHPLVGRAFRLGKVTANAWKQNVRVGGAT
jgi:hypothetical protein